MNEQSQTEDYFDRVAARYLDRYYSTESGLYPNLQLRADIVMQALTDSVEPGGHILDAGCGVGNLIGELARRGYIAHGVDLAPNMIQMAASSIATLPDDASARCYIQKGDIEALPYQNAFFDAAVASGVIEYLTADEPALKELRRVLRGSGIALISFRNRTFNTYSANAYTIGEMESGELEGLLESAMEQIQQDAERIRDRVQHFYRALAKASEKLERFPSSVPTKSDPLAGTTNGQGEQFWKKTMTRRQHTLAGVKVAAQKAGFDLERVFFFHFHPFPPSLRDLMPEAYDTIGLAMESFRETRLGILFASGFVAMLRAREER